MPRSHRNQRERAAVHFLTNISLDGVTYDCNNKKPAPFVPGPRCDCDHCRASLVPNENFTRSAGRSSFNESPIPPIDEEEVDAELMSLWSGRSLTVNGSSPLPLGDDPSSSSPWIDR